MGRKKKTHLMFLLLALLCVGVAQAENCPSDPDIARTDLSCESDYNRTITCLWNSTSASDLPDNVCTLKASRTSKRVSYNAECKLEPVDVSRPTLRKCTLIFKLDNQFVSYDNLLMDLNCNPGNQTLNVYFKPACHIKLNPPPQPRINFTTASWFPQVVYNHHFDTYSCQLQWKHQNQSWSESNVLDTSSKRDCSVELNLDELNQGERYEARVRVKTSGNYYKSMWSDWSPTASWVSPIGGTKEPPPPPPPPPYKGFPGGFLAIIAGAAAFSIFLVVLRFKTNKTTWVYVVKRIRGKPIPDPADSFLQHGDFKNWLRPPFTSESFLSPSKLVEIVSVEVTSSVDTFTSCGPEAALLEKMRSESRHESTSSNFSNPIYSQLCPPPPPPPPPVSSLTAGNLAPCAAETPYGPVGGQAEGKNAEQDEDEVRAKEAEIRQLLSKGSNNSEPMLVVSDYEKAEKLHVERARLQSLDSGVCSGEEVSQESLEADSINVTDEGPEGEEEREAGNEKDVVIQKLFEGSGGDFGKGPIQVCSGYEQVQKLQADSPELDSGISSGGEEQVSQEESQEESLEESLEDVDKSTESTSLLFPPPLPPPPPYSVSPFFTPQPLNFFTHLSPALHPQHLLETTALMSTTRSVEPSGDGYM